MFLADRLRQLYRVAKANTFVRADGTRSPKFVNLDMEEYRDLKLTVELFKKVLNEPEFKEFSAGIVLQAYLPDAHEIQKELTLWAMDRVKRKGRADQNPDRQRRQFSHGTIRVIAARLAANPLYR